MAHNNNASEKTKQIDIKLKFVHFDLERETITLDLVPTEQMLADGLTKTNSID